MELNELTIIKVREGLKAKQFSATELAQAYLARIKEKDADIHAYLTVMEEAALAQAKEVDEKIADGLEVASLAGIPCAIKDNILIEGIRATAGSKILENYIAPYDATVIRKLKKVGAVILGKTNCDEFAMGSSTENSAYGVTRNPNDLERVPGGSSGGSAAAVAGDECVFALGSDTGGSIRQPASFCGVVGLKPTYGAVSRYGVMAMASSLDQIGPLAKSVEDCKIVFDAIRGKDGRDATSMNNPTLPPLKLRGGGGGVKDLRIGVPKEYFAKGLDKGVEKTIKTAIDKLVAQGARVEEISLPHSEYALACYYIIMASEVSANLARFDGIKYGVAAREAQNLLEVYSKSRQQGLGDEVRRRIMLGTYSLSSGYCDAYYLRAQKVRTKIAEDFKKAFEKVDLIMAPVAPTTAFKIGEKMDDPVQMYLSDIYTVPVNLAGLPALSLPVGKIDGLPVGLQIIAPHFSEELIFQAAQIIENILR